MSMRAAWRSLPPEYRHEPRLRAGGGKTGFDLVRRIAGRGAHGTCARTAPSSVRSASAREPIEAAFPQASFLFLWLTR